MSGNFMINDLDGLRNAAKAYGFKLVELPKKDKQLMKLPGKFEKQLKQHMPSFTVDPKIRIDYEVKGCMRGITGDPRGLRGDCSGIYGNVTTIFGDVSGLIGDVSFLSGDVTGLRGDVTGIMGTCTGLKGFIKDFIK